MDHTWLWMRVCGKISQITSVLLLPCMLMLHTTSAVEVIDMRIPHVAPAHMDSYYCVPFKVPAGDRYIVRFQPQAKMQVVHHMFLYGCGQPSNADRYWENCDKVPACSGGKETILYAWGKNAGPLTMPPDTGMHVGGDSGYNYFVLQLHYLHVDQFKNGHTDNSGLKITLDRHWKSHVAGIYLIGDALTLVDHIPPHRKQWHLDSGCSYDTPGPTFHVFRFRVHTHSLGTVVTGYRVRDGVWTLIGRGDPQQPQAFYKTDHVIDVQPGDKLMMRCTFDSTNRDRTTYIGATHADEMCNFYVMYYYDTTDYGQMKSFPCQSSRHIAYQLKSMTYPPDSDQPKMSSPEDATEVTQDVTSDEMIGKELDEEILNDLFEEFKEETYR